ncbi:glycosyltransferase family 2 protein [Sphingobacterium sp. UBA1498]|uniref:glycosyltransferase family 2 protein n=1 Tax=Sphingobacterium sp. UBA1498 TaxID=1947481 RepID=UPI0025FD10F6|nr:glycosyltransferase family 2 protein [Sphingobacterium sp. UBA1498]
MAKWYTQYANVYDYDMSSVDDDIIEKIGSQIKLFSSSDPVVSIVVIAYNEEKKLLACLWSLAKQQCHLPMELIVVNNNSTDRTESLLKRLGVTYYNELKQGPGFARQCGLDQARGNFMLCVDGDTMYPPNYAETHMKVLDRPGVSATFSLWSFLPLAGQSRTFFWFYEGLRDIYLNLQYIKRPELCVRGMVFSFKTDFGREVGFRTDIKRGEDGSMALGLKHYGKLRFIRSKKARALTGQNTLGADGSLAKSFLVRLRKAIRSLSGLFSGKKHYQDEDSNKIQ